MFEHIDLTLRSFIPGGAQEIPNIEPNLHNAIIAGLARLTKYKAYAEESHYYYVAAGGTYYLRLCQ